MDYIAKNECNLLGIYKFPEFDLYAYKEDKKTSNNFLKNIFSISTNALSCYPVDSLEGGDYVLVNNDPNKKVDYNLQNLTSAKNFYVGGDYNRATDGYMENFINNLNIFQQKNVLSGRGDDPIVLLGKKTGEFIQNPDKKDPNKYTLSENSIDWTKLNQEQKTLIENTKKEMQDNFEFKYRELIDSGCVYTSSDCKSGYEVLTKDSKNTISEKDKEARLLTAEVGYPGAQELQNPSAQRIMDLSNPENLEIKFNLVFNYQQKTGEFWDRKNDCERHESTEKFNKLSKTDCQTDYKVAKYAPSGKLKLVQIKVNSKDKGKTWQASDVKSSEYQMPQDFVEFKFNKEYFGDKYITKELLEDTSYPKELLENNNYMEDKNGKEKDFNVYNYPYQQRIWLK